MTLNLLIGAWLILVQPGMSYYWLISPHVHAEIDAELYGQSPTGETLPGHTPHLPHQHPISPGMTAPESTISNPVDLGVRASIWSAAQQLALLNRVFEISEAVESLVIEPPRQPPRATL
ncbi:MAG: hypothetical protein U0559_13060 [Anaerolineae bacterium]